MDTLPTAAGQKSCQKIWLRQGLAAGKSDAAPAFVIEKPVFFDLRHDCVDAHVGAHRHGIPRRVSV
jgi:hypothetical protein